MLLTGAHFSRRVVEAGYEFLLDQLWTGCEPTLTNSQPSDQLPANSQPTVTRLWARYGSCVDCCAFVFRLLCVDSVVCGLLNE